MTGLWCLVILGTLVWQGYGNALEAETNRLEHILDQYDPKFGCVSDGQYPNYDNCNTFIQCSNRIKTVMPCPKDLHYSEKTKRCEQPCDARCNVTLSCQCKWPTCGLEDFCFLPNVTGPCRAGFQNYYFNKFTGKCETFIYGGCDGNKNNFKNKEDCEKSCSKKKEPDFKCGPDGLYPNPENCSSFIQCSNGQKHIMPCPEDLHYDVKTKRCQKPCDAYCDKTLSCSCKWATCGKDDVCFLPKEVGICKDGVSRIFFNKRTGKCEPFRYGGCRGNENNFQTVKECEERCLSPVEYEEEFRCGPDGLFRNPENCSSFVQCSNGQKHIMPCPKNLHYDEEKKRCERPCDAYCNKTLSCECKWPTCGKDDVCFLPKDAGTGEDIIPMFFFNKRTGICEPFYYTGKGGNENNFRTLRECTKRCLVRPSSESDSLSSFSFCGLPASVGPCKEFEVRYHYDMLTDKCETFNYSGCEGNRNNFKTKEACEKECGHQSSDGCQSHSDCSPTQECFKNQCQFACKLGTCGIGAKCRVIDHVAQCRCPPGYKGDPHVRCRPENESEFMCDSDGLHPNPDNCSSFIQCSNGQKHIMPCPKDLHYDENKKRCERPCDAYCNKTMSCQCKWSTCGLDDVCFLSMDVGICRAMIPRIFFNKRTGKCERFQYGGCGGNENNFQTVKECEERCHVQNDENICRLPAETGPCLGHIPRYFFDHTKGNCERFIYGGCKGNANNFQSLRECETRCLRKTLNSEDTCRLPSKKGPCKGHFPRYFFDHTKGKCEEFIYGGCDGNANNFETVRECEQACLRQSMNSENTCRLPSETGLCDGYFPRYFFDHTKGNCEEFVYGGCGGNSNNFKTREECELRCLMKTSISKDTCRLPSDEGTCRGFFPRYFFDHTKGKCVKFVFGGCDGNANNFKTKEECELRCLRKTLNSENTCRLPSEKGPCKGHFTRYFFDHTKGKCEEFIYGGCKGNANNFQTVRECEQECLRQSANSEDTCRLPSKQGPCKGHFPRYFFDHTKGKCEEFIYGGCDGNANNFETVRECELACLRNSETVDDICKLPSKTGPCKGHIPRYFFDYTKGSCEEFIYGGCEANANNFETVRECENRCLRKILNSEDTCWLPPEKGPCRGRFPKYFFDHTKGKCEEFIYGGCGGNANNFETEKECEQACLRKSEAVDDICRLPSKTGPCKGHIPRYFFDHTKGSCEEFIYGGCEANDNNFETVRECENKCLRKTLNSEDTCWLPPEKGPCRGRFPKYFFDHTKGKCEEFIYGGCGGNANNFETEKECEQACLRKSEAVDDICRLPSKTGPCKGHIPRYFFDHTKGSCEEFIYGGCEANDNNFETVRECENKCLRKTLNPEDTCKLPSEKGPCKGHFPRYFFDHTKGKCEEFIYGGCKGNANNFETVRECEQACLRHSANSEDTCRLPSKQGPCKGHFPRYFFDHTKGKCEEFIYGGCDGNANNFETVSECEQACLHDSEVSEEKPCSVEGKFKDPENCESYLECLNGVEKRKTCPRGLHFNEASKECDSPCDAHCDISLGMRCRWPMYSDYSDY